MMKGTKREVIPHIGLTLKIIPLKISLDLVSSFPAGNHATRVEWMVSWRMKIRVKPLGLST